MLTVFFLCFLYTNIIMKDLAQTASDCKTSKDQILWEDMATDLIPPKFTSSLSDETDITAEGAARAKFRARAVSLSFDWDHVVHSLEGAGQKIRKISRGDELDEEADMRHPGFVQIERSTHIFNTGSSYTGQWNGVGMSGNGNYAFPHAQVPKWAKNAPRFKGQSMTFQLPNDGDTLMDKPIQFFSNESSYMGQWYSLGIGGFGLYSFPHEVDYDGTLRDGMFHGEGMLTYPMGQKIEGQWIKGKLVSFKFRFADGLEYDEPWKYCQMPDRRFHKSILEGLRPAGRSLLTNNDPPREIPEGCYDTGDGFYNPATKCVWSAIKPNKILRVPTAAEEKWIIENCRKAWDEPSGYAPDLFEHWVSGRRNDSVFQEPEIDAGSPPTDDMNSRGSLDINMIVPPTYNVSPASSLSWWESPNYGLPIESSTDI